MKIQQSPLKGLLENQRGENSFRENLDLDSYKPYLNEFHQLSQHLFEHDSNVFAPNVRDQFEIQEDKLKRSTVNEFSITKADLRFREGRNADLSPERILGILKRMPPFKNDEVKQADIKLFSSKGKQGWKYMMQQILGNQKINTKVQQFIKERYKPEPEPKPKRSSPPKGQFKAASLALDSKNYLGLAKMERSATINRRVSQVASDERRRERSHPLKKQSTFRRGIKETSFTLSGADSIGSPSLHSKLTRRKQSRGTGQKSRESSMMKTTEKSDKTPQGLMTIREGRNIVVHDEQSRTHTRIQVENMSPGIPTRNSTQVELNKFHAFRDQQQDPILGSEEEVASLQSIESLESLIELHAPVSKQKVRRRKKIGKKEESPRKVWRMREASPQKLGPVPTIVWSGGRPSASRLIVSSRLQDIPPVSQGQPPPTLRAKQSPRKIAISKLPVQTQTQVGFSKGKVQLTISSTMAPSRFEPSAKLSPRAVLKSEIEQPRQCSRSQLLKPQGNSVPSVPSVVQQTLPSAIASSPRILKSAQIENYYSSVLMQQRLKSKRTQLQGVRYSVSQLERPAMHMSSQYLTQFSTTESQTRAQSSTVQNDSFAVGQIISYDKIGPDPPAFESKDSDGILWNDRCSSQLGSLDQKSILPSVASVTMIKQQIPLPQPMKAPRCLPYYNSSIARTKKEALPPSFARTCNYFEEPRRSMKVARKSKPLRLCRMSSGPKEARQLA